VKERPFPSGSDQTPHPFPTLSLAPESVLQTVPSEIEASIIAAREHNASVPMNNLPPELFTKILQMALEDAKRPQRFLLNILLVCRTWNQVVLDSPTLWTRWDILSSRTNRNALQYLQRILVQSKSLGLTLSCSFWAQAFDGPLYGELGRCISQWQDVTLMDIAGETFFAMLPKLGNDTAPKLRSLYLRADDRYRPLDIFDPNDPCPLEKLELWGTSVVWSTLNFERLRYLHVSGPCQGPPSVPELFQILERSQRLEYLCLTGMNLSPEFPSLSMPSEPVCLPHLSYCQIACPHTADTLIRMIRFPSCKEVSVSESLISGPGSLSSLAHVVHVIENAIKEKGTTLSLIRDEFWVNTFPERSSRLGTKGEQEVVLRWFINMAREALNASPAVKISLDSTLPHDQIMRIITELSDLKNVTELDFAGNWLSAAHHCNPLDCIDNLGDKIQQWFPRLHTLVFSVNTLPDLESLYRVLLRRHQAVTSKEQAHLSPFRKVMIDDYLYLKGNYKDQLDAIRSLIAGGSLRIGLDGWGIT
ncbi:hypothetical protein FRC01_004419, partial [Tulasnella sp. 417]